MPIDQKGPEETSLVDEAELAAYEWDRKFYRNTKAAYAARMDRIVELLEKAQLSHVYIGHLAHVPHDPWDAAKDVIREASDVGPMRFVFPVPIVSSLGSIVLQNLNKRSAMIIAIRESTGRVTASHIQAFVLKRLQSHVHNARARGVSVDDQSRRIPVSLWILALAIGLPSAGMVVWLLGTIVDVVRTGY